MAIDLPARSAPSAWVNVLHAFDQNDIGANEIATLGYTLVSAELSYTDKLTDTSSLGSEYTIGIKGENLADDEVLNHASFKRSEDVLLPGASMKGLREVQVQLAFLPRRAWANGCPRNQSPTRSSNFRSDGMSV